MPSALASCTDLKAVFDISKYIAFILVINIAAITTRHNTLVKV